MTVLIIGGAYQGKKELAKKLFNLNNNDFNGIDGKAVYNLQDYIKNNNISDINYFANRLKDKIIICNEIGCGVIPIDKNLDDWRETTGRICCEIANFADVVIRVTAGIPQFIKGRI